MAITGNFKGTSHTSFRAGKTGATLNADGHVGEVNHVDFLNAPSVPANAEGNQYFDATHKTLALQTDDTLHLIRVGQDIQATVYNGTGGTLTRGQAVYISGSNGTHPTVALATATSAISARVVGIVASDIADTTVGHITLFGRMASIDTSAFGQGDVLYVDATTPGALTNVKPSTAIKVAIVTVQNLVGDIAVTAIGSGSGGRSLNDTTIKTANYAAAASDLVLCNSTGGVFNVELPTAPQDGDVIGIFDVYGTFDSNVVTVTRANVLHKIQGITDELDLDFAGVYVELKFIAATSDWRIQDNLVMPLNVSLTPTTTKTAPYTAADREMVAVDTSGGAVTITLPATPSNGTRLAVFDIVGFAGTNVITIDRNGGLIAGVAADDVIDSPKGYTEYVYDALAASPTWVRVDKFTSNRFPDNEFRIYDNADPNNTFLEWNLAHNTYSTTIYPPRSASTYKMGDVPAFSALLNYTTGDQVIYGNRHYIALGNRAAAAWDGTVFTEVGSYVAVKDYDNNIQTGGFTPVVNTFYKVNTNGGAVTVNLPATPANKDRIGLLDYRSTWNTNAMTIVRGNVAHFIDAVAASYVVNEPGYVELEWDSTNSNWMFIQRPGYTLTETEYQRVTGVATDFIPVPDGTTAQRGAPSNPAIRYNTTLNAFEGWNGTAWGTIGGGGAELTVTQAAHGFVVGQALQMDAAVWALARADDPSTLGVGIISAVTDANTFKISFGGEVTGFVGLTAGDYYYVSDSVAGGLTATEPATYSNPILLATSATTGVVLPYRPSVGTSDQPAHNNTTGLQGGTAGEYYHVTAAEKTAVESVTAVGGNIGKNKIINGNPIINQRAYVSGAATLVGEYTLDRWKVTNTTGITFSTTNNKTTIVIPAGQTIQQVIEGQNLQNGTYTLSWEGSAQGRVDGGAYGASGLTAVVIGGNNVTVEFNTGTVTNIQFEFGSLPTQFEQRLYADELALCQRYYNRIGASGSASQSILLVQGGTNLLDGVVVFPVQMRSTNVIISSIGAWSWTAGVPGALQIGVFDYTANGWLSSSHSSITLQNLAVSGSTMSFRMLGNGGAYGGAGGRTHALYFGSSAGFAFTSEL